MIIITQSCTTKRSVTQSLPSKYSWLRLLVTLGNGVLFSAVSLSMNASSLSSSSDYLDYELPKERQERCIERDYCPQIEVKYLKANHDWINKITNARIDALVMNSKPTDFASTATGIDDSHTKSVRGAVDDLVSS